MECGFREDRIPTCNSICLVTESPNLNAKGSIVEIFMTTKVWCVCDDLIEHRVVVQLVTGHLDHQKRT